MSRKSNTPKLTEQQDIFCQEYLIDLNGTQAAIRAGYSEHTASEQAARLLGKVIIQDRVNALMQKREKRTEASANRVLEELAKIGLADIRKLFDVDGKMLPPDRWPDEIAASVSSLEIEEKKMQVIGFDGEVEEKVTSVLKRVRFWDKTKALEMIGKHLKLFVDRVEHEVVNSEDTTYEAEFTRLPDKTG